MATKRARNINAKAAETDPRVDNERLVIPVIQEEITVEKQIVETGKVRISKRISEHEELVDVPLFAEEVQVERVPVNLFVEALPPVRQEGDTMIIPVVREEIVIQKKLLLVEELRVRKALIERHQPQTVNVRKEEVEVKGLPEIKMLTAQTKKVNLKFSARNNKQNNQGGNNNDTYSSRFIQ